MTLLIFNRGQENEGGNWQNGRRGASRLVVQRAPAPVHPQERFFPRCRRQCGEICRHSGGFVRATALVVQWKMLENTARKGDTRERLLALAESAVLAKGFAATSIEELIAAAGISKSGFFYHFKDKGELAKAMMLRYIEQDTKLLDDIFARADELNDDPLHGLLVALKLFAEMLANLPEAHPGCLAASFCYQDQLFNQGIRDLNAGSILRWRTQFRARLDAVAERYPPRRDIDPGAIQTALGLGVDGPRPERRLHSIRLMARA